MHEKEIVTILQSARGETDAPLHRTHLRRTVLSAPRDRSFAPLQNLITNISMNKYYLSVGTVALVAAIAVLVAVSPLSTHVVSAQEQVQRAYARAVAISPAVRAELEANMKADMLATLAEAKAAPDLKIMTKEEYEKDGQFQFRTGPGAGGVQGSMTSASFTVAQGQPSEAGVDAVYNVKANADFSAGQPVGVGGTVMGGQIMLDHPMGTASGTVSALAVSTWSPVKYLSYTDKSGHKVVLGLDENDTPVFKMSTLNADDVKQMGNGAVEVQGAPLHVMRFNAEAGIEAESNQ
jgi:hypothetical protein